MIGTKTRILSTQNSHDSRNGSGRIGIKESESRLFTSGCFGSRERAVILNISQRWAVADTAGLAKFAPVPKETKEQKKGGKEEREKMMIFPRG